MAARTCAASTTFGKVALDGVLTFGIAMEGNPLVAALGVCLHLNEIHSVLALLAGFYFTAAVAPWAFILFF